MFAKNFFKKILENYLFLCYNYVRGGKGAYKKMIRLGALFFIIIIYMAKNFLEKLFKKGLQFSFCFDIIVLSMRGSDKNASRSKI